jgi:hypothetical protein
MPPPQRKSSNVVWIVLGIVGALVTLLFCAGMIGAYLIGQTPEVQRVGQLIGEGLELAQEAQTGPGTAELRAAGCQIAMVVRPEQLEGLGRVLFDGGFPETERQTTVVNCVQHRDAPALTCEEVVRVYVAAVPSATGPLHVTVSRGTEQEPSCQGTFATDGTPVVE